MLDKERTVPEATEEDAISVPEERPRFYIDLQWYDDHGRSFRAVAQARFCKSCQSKIGTESQERVPTVDERTGRIVFEMRSTPFGSSPLSVIRNCCARDKDYITAETPVLEAVFRVFLANGNQPSDLQTVREQLAEWVSLNARPQAYSEETIEQLVRSDDYYGLREFRIGSE
ncbi:MAG: hypothetical protein M1370_01670 [Bacteroidetes bacterium]|nr:hypothetical protein [Bacteroidota bacterium]MCL5026456.1 hypothetical protein [Chloroflexota bacterium]